MLSNSHIGPDILVLAIAMCALMGAWLAVHRSGLSWPFRLVGAALLGVLSFDRVPWVELVPVGLIMLASVFGWYRWRRAHQPFARFMTHTAAFAWTIVAAAGMGGWGWVRMKYGMDLSFWLAAIHVLTIIGLGLQAGRVAEGWLMLAAADAMACSTGWSNDDYAATFISAVLVTTSLGGFREWIRRAREEVAAESPV